MQSYFQDEIEIITTTEFRCLDPNRKLHREKNSKKYYKWLDQLGGEEVIGIFN